jgi:hypothetical protein
MERLRSVLARLWRGCTHELVDVDDYRVIVVDRERIGVELGSCLDCGARIARSE